MNFNLVFLVLARLLQILFSLMTLKIISSIYSESDVGSYYLILTYSSFFVLFFHSPVTSYINRFFYKIDKFKMLKSTLLNYFLYSVMVGALGGPLLFTFYCFFNYTNISPAIFVLAVSLSAISQAVFNRFVYSLNMLSEVMVFSIVLMFSSIFSLITSYFLSFVIEMSLVWVFSSSFILLMCSLFSYFYISLRKKEKKFRFITYKQCVSIARFSIPVAVSSSFMWFINVGYRILVENKYSLEELAQLAVGFSIPIAIFSAVNTISTQYFYPKFYHEVNIGKGDVAWMKLAKISIGIYFLTMIFVIGLSKEVLIVLTGKSFHGLYFFVILGAFLEFLRYSTSIYSLYTHVKLTPKKTILPYFFGAISLFLGLRFLPFNSMFDLMIFVIFSYLIVFFLVFFRVNAPVFSFSKKDVALASLCLIFFPPVFFIRENSTLLQSFCFVAFFGLIYLSILILFYKNWISENA